MNTSTDFYQNLRVKSKTMFTLAITTEKDTYTK